MFHFNELSHKTEDHIAARIVEAPRLPLLQFDNIGRPPEWLVFGRIKAASEITLEEKLLARIPAAGERCQTLNTEERLL